MEAMELGSWIGILASEGVGTPVDRIRHPSVGLAPTPVIGALFVVTADSITMHGEGVGDPQTATVPQLARRLIEMNRPGLGPTASPPVLLIGSNASWSSIVVLVGAFEQLSYPAVDFAFVGTSRISSPHTSRSGSLRGALAGCEPALESLRHAEVEHLTAQLVELSTTLPAAVEQCRCGIDFELAKMALWRRMFRHEGVPLAVVRINVDRTSELTVSANAKATWREVYDLIIAASKDGRTVSLQRESD